MELKNLLSQTTWPEQHNLEKMVVTKRLKVKAKCNFGHKYDVCLTMTNLPADSEFGFKWVLSIDNTPGSYYMSTLLEGDTEYSSGLAIDLGANWVITNFKEVFEEAKKLI